MARCERKKEEARESIFWQKIYLGNFGLNIKICKHLVRGIFFVSLIHNLTTATPLHSSVATIHEQTLTRQYLVNKIEQKLPFFKIFGGGLWLFLFTVT